jgi:hypothetical protein
VISGTSRAGEFKKYIVRLAGNRLFILSRYRSGYFLQYLRNFELSMMQISFIFLVSLLKSFRAPQKEMDSD